MKVSFFFSAVKFFEFQGHFFIEVSLDLTNNLSCSHTSASKDLTLCTELKKKAVVGKNTPQVLSLTPEGSRLHLFQIPVGFQCLRAQKHQAQWVNSSLNLKRKKNQGMGNRGQVFTGIGAASLQEHSQEAQSERDLLTSHHHSRPNQHFQ